MMSAPIRHSVLQQAPAIEDRHEAARWRLNPKALTAGDVDRARWPQSRKLSAELPARVVVPGVRPGRIERVSFDLTAWGPTVRKLPLVKGEYGGVRQVARTAQQLDGDGS
jgi:hypothetical protein